MSNLPPLSRLRRQLPSRGALPTFFDSLSRQLLLPRSGMALYFLRKDLQSVHWSTVGLVS